MSRYAGVDYSFTSPAITVYDTETQKYTHYNLTSNKKLVSSRDDIKLTLFKPWEKNEDRFAQVSDWAMSILEGCKEVYIEGYSYGSKGSVFEIGENTGLLKNRIWKAGINDVFVFAPTVIKKIATGSGRAKKPEMEAAFTAERGFDIRKVIGQSEKAGNPSSDIADSYFVLKTGFTHSNF